jgi:hypothetical protein
MIGVREIGALPIELHRSRCPDSNRGLRFLRTAPVLLRSGSSPRCSGRLDDTWTTRTENLPDPEAMASSSAPTVERYLGELADDRRALVGAIRDVVNANPPAGSQGGDSVRDDRLIGASTSPATTPSGRPQGRTSTERDVALAGATPPPQRRDDASRELSTVALIAAMATTTDAARPLHTRQPATEDEDLVVELPGHLPCLTARLARALLAAITRAAVNVGVLEGADDEATERLAS